MSAKSEQLSRLDEAYEQFRASIANLPAEAYAETWLGSWNLSQVLAHMAGWWSEMAPAFDRVAAGQRPVPEGVDYSNADSWNDRFAANAKPGLAALEDWDAAFRQYRAAAASLDEDLYGIDPEKQRPRIGNRLLGTSGIGHFEEHQDDLEQWLRSRGS
jgi:hypothetical protein